MTEKHAVGDAGRSLDIAGGNNHTMIFSHLLGIMREVLPAERFRIEIV